MPEEYITGVGEPMTISFSLKEKIAVITGASRGIGEAIAETLAAHNAHCILVSRKEEALKQVAEKIRKNGGSADVIACHMELDSGQQNQINETTVVYLADKLVSGHRVIALNERLRDLLNQFSEKAAQQAARERIGEATKIQKRIEGILNLKLESIFDEHI